MKYQGRIALGSIAVILALLLGAAGCGKSLRTGPDPGAVSRVSVAAATDGTVRAGETKKFVAVAVTSAGEAIPTDYAWSLQPPTLGTVTGNGAEALVTGKTPGSGTLIAVASNGVRGEFPIVVVAGPVADLRVESKTGKTTVEAGESVGFIVTGIDTGGNVVGQSRARIVLSPAWSVEGGIGTITPDGVFTAAAAGIGKTGQVVAQVDNVRGTINVSVVRGSRALYAGSDACKGCHPNEHHGEAETKHFAALQTLKAIGQGNNASCLPCHTVGYSQGGFVSEAVTPGLAGVQCENCHGPGSEHIAGNGDPTKIVKGADVQQAIVCGKCHTDAHHPTFDEFEHSPHAEVNEEVAQSLETGGEARAKSCGPCHSGSVRLALLKNKPLPDGHDAARVGITCSVCHDPHAITPAGQRLRNPLASLIPFSYNTAATTSFAAQYDPNVQLCAQCHNSRGANWRNTSRPPHHSPQYNILIGNGGVEEGVVPQSAHRNLQKQCAQCHMYRRSVQSPTEENPNITGHSFMVRVQACNPCHTEADAGARQAATQTDIHQRLARVKARLDRWASSMAPEALRTKYGPLAWEYTVVGQLSNPTGDPAIVGPSSAEQASIPDEVKQARFNLYLVEHDASYGVHNAKYVRYLLQVANAKLDALGVP